MVAKEGVAKFIILKFLQIPISILCHCNDDTDKAVCTCTYRHIYIHIILIFFCYTNVIALFNRFYNTVLEQKVLTCKNQIFFLQQGDTGKCTHFPYLMFSIIKIISDHIIEKKYI